MRSYIVGEKEDVILSDLAKKSKDFPHFIEILEKSVNRRYGSDRIKTFCSELGKFIQENEGNVEYSNLLKIATPMWEYVKVHGLSDNAVSYLRMEMLLN